VCLSKERIGSPLVAHPDVLIAMNEISLRKFAGEVTPGGVITTVAGTGVAGFSGKGASSR
jgi:hypothetical protein